jgi:hypothetical protein
MIDTRYSERGRQAYMNNITSKAPAGIMELYSAVLARGPVSVSQRQSSQSVANPAAASPAQLESEVSRITAELDSGMYFTEVQEGIQAFNQWLSSLSPPTPNS